MLLSLPRQVVLLFLLLCFGRFVPQPGSDQKSDGNAGQKTERIHADILNHSGAARDKELVEFISARIGGTGQDVYKRQRLYSLPLWCALTRRIRPIFSEAPGRHCPARTRCLAA